MWLSSTPTASHLPRPHFHKCFFPFWIPVPTITFDTTPINIKKKSSKAQLYPFPPRLRCILPPPWNHTRRNQEERAKLSHAPTHTRVLSRSRVLKESSRFWDTPSRTRGCWKRLTLMRLARRTSSRMNDWSSWVTRF